MGIALLPRLEYLVATSFILSVITRKIKISNHCTIRGLTVDNRCIFGNTIIFLAKEIMKSDPIYPGSNFHWWEATNFGKRKLNDINIRKNVIRTSGNLDRMREFLGGQPVIITSWYRDPVSNKSVGGTSNSRHLTGDGVDFFVRHLTPKQVYQRLDPWHGSKGGLGLYSGHIHIDWRGYRARW